MGNFGSTSPKPPQPPQSPSVTSLPFTATTVASSPSYRTKRQAPNPQAYTPSRSFAPSTSVAKPIPKEASRLVIFSANDYVIPNNLSILTTEYIPKICVPYRSKVDKFPMRVCPQYNSLKGCNIDPCHRFHICQFWVKGDCKKECCTYLHSFNSSHNSALLNPHMRRNFGKEQLLEALKKSFFFGKSKVGNAGGNYICIGYIHKNCRISNCNFYHVPSHFMWEISIGDNWESFTPKQNAEIEKAFSNPKNITLVLSKLPSINNSRKPSLLHQVLRENSCTVDFEKLSLISLNSFFRIRRLSTQSDILYCHSSATRWLWYWQDTPDKWHAFSSGTINDYFVIPLSDHLEYLFLKNSKEVNVTINETLYRINFESMTQVNTVSGYVRLIRRRPMLITTVEKLNPNATFRNVWTKLSDSSIKYERKDVSCTSCEYVYFSSMLLKTLPLIKDIIVQRIENPFLWESYQLKKKQYLDKYGNDADKVNEQYLFHGTNHSVIDKICTDGFDWRLFGTSVGSVYGRGTYFSNEAKFSNDYASFDDNGYKSMFIALVLVGLSTIGDHSMTIPPHNIATNKRFDTTVNNDSNPNIFVKYDLDEYYPAYYIKYKVEN